MLYGPNVVLAFVFAVGIFVVVLGILTPQQYRLTPGDDDSFRARLQRFLAQADLQISAGEFVRTSTLIGFVLGAVGYVLTNAIAVIPLGLLIGFFGYFSVLEDRRDKRRREYQEALVDVVNIIHETFAARGSLNVALAAVAEHAPKIIRNDFVQIASQLSLGESLEHTLTTIAERRRDMILDRLVEALLANQRTGGQQIGQVLNALRQSVIALAAGRRRIATAQSRIRWEARIVCVSPFLFLVLMRQTAPDLQEPFLSSPLGQAAVLIIGLLSVLAYYIMNRIGSKALAPLESAGVHT